MRAVWTGSISFGLVNIPVRLYPATSPKDPRFHQIDRQTGRRVRYRRVVEEPPVPPPAVEAPPIEEEGSSEPTRPDPVILPERAPERAAPSERDVPYAEVVKGYDVGEGQHVVLEPEELEALRPEPSRTIDIEHFVSLTEIDPVYFEKSYHVLPAGEGAEKPYSLLLKAMEDTGRVGVGRFVLRSREHLAAIRPTRGILGLETLYFADEVREPPDRLGVTDTDVSEKELKMAEALIEALASDWDPSRYEDTYRRRIEELIQAREPQAAPVEVGAEEEGGAVQDLMAALKASVEALGEEQGSRKKGTRSRKAGGAGRR